MAPAPGASPTVRLGRYRLLLELGEGGMARVFVAFSSGLGGFNKLVVLKVMRDELRENESSLAMFLAEARLAARMNHQNIVQTLEVGEDGGRYFICMEYLEGQTLGRLLKRTVETPLPLAARLELICQVLEALVYMHAFTDPDGTPLGLVHRDISPNNIFVTFDGTAKVLDFGVAKALGVSHATEAGTFKGKLGYAAPEQILGNSEQRSAGVDAELMRKALGVPVDLLQICMRAAAKRVEDRYASALEMRDALRGYIRSNNLECSPEQLRTLLGELYATDRVEIRRLIDQRMKQANLEDDHPGSEGSIPIAPAMLSGLNTVTLTANASYVSQHPPPPGKGKWIAALVGVAALAGVAGRWFSDSAQQAKATGSALAAASAAAQRVNEPAKPQVLITLKVSATPADSEIFLDGARLDGNPFSGQFPKDLALRRLEVRCLGRATEARMVRFDQDLDLLVALQVDKAVPIVRGASATAIAGKATAKRAGDSASASGTTPAAAGAIAPLTHQGAATGARPIDDSDPYAK
jgi:serine/threonine-protein kinase